MKNDTTKTNRFEFNYRAKKDEKVKHYTIGGIIENNSQYLVAYKFSDGEQGGIRRFNKNRNSRRHRRRLWS